MGMLYGYLDPAPMGLVRKEATEQEVRKMVAEAVAEGPVPYQGVSYERSPLVFAHLPLEEYMKARGIEMSEQFDRLVRSLPDGAYLAGGYVAWWMNGCRISTRAKAGETDPSDIDIFFRDQEAFDKTVKLLSFAYRELKGPSGEVRAFKPEDGFTVQAINIVYFPEGIENVLDGFDFTATHFGIDVGKKELVFNPVAPADYSQLHLVCHREEGEDATRRRMAKYIAKGFVPVGPTMKRAKDFGLYTKMEKAK